MGERVKTTCAVAAHAKAKKVAKSLLIGLMLLVALFVAPSEAAEQTFNSYILRAVEQLRTGYGGRGYNIHNSYTHDFSYGGGIIKAKSPPLTMCVAAVAEVIAVAINLYVEETGDGKAYDHLPVAGWNRMRAGDIRSHIWVDPKLGSYGTADALVSFGVGKRSRFADLTPGSFINLNRTNKTGHAVVFLSFLDQNGKEFSTDKQPPLDQIAGFKYFSAQNRNTHGMGFGYAFFSNKNGKSYCPALPGGLSPDCGVEFSLGQKLLNTGYMLAPSLWDKSARDENIKEIIEGLYVQTKSRGPSFLGISPDLSLQDFSKALEDQDTMSVNPIYENAE